MAVLPLMATDRPNSSNAPASEAVSFISCPPVVTSNRYAEPEFSPPSPSSKSDPTMTVLPLMATEPPKWSFAAASEAVSSNSSSPRPAARHCAGRRA